MEKYMKEDFAYLLQQVRTLRHGNYQVEQPITQNDVYWADWFLSLIRCVRRQPDERLEKLNSSVNMIFEGLIPGVDIHDPSAHICICYECVEEHYNEYESPLPKESELYTEPDEYELMNTERPSEVKE